MKVIATDLDRTLLPNGKEDYDNSLPEFKKIVRENDISLIYVTGRNLNLVKKAINKFKIPYPDYILTNVGTRIYFTNKKKKEFYCDRKWFEKINKETPDWNIKKMRSSLKSIGGLRLQEKEKQDKFKLSYFVDLDMEKEVLKEVKKKLKNFKNIEIIYSVDYPEPRGLLDILPSCATKKGALDYILNKMNEEKGKIRKEDVIVCGDSGNDLPLLKSKYKSILVKNSDKELKKKIKKEKKNKNKYFIAKSGGYNKKLNGNYVSGILQGLVYFDFIDKKELDI